MGVTNTFKPRYSITEATLSICLVARYRGLEPVSQKSHRKTKKERDIMSKTQSRKGYAVGALVALVSSMITFAPAQADANGPVTLMPTAGTTFNTIIGSPIQLGSSLDPNGFSSTAAAFTQSYYVIKNPDKAAIKVTFDNIVVEATTATFSYITYDADGVGTSVSGVSDATIYNFTGAGTTTGMTLETTASHFAVKAGATASAAAVLGTIQLDTTGTTTSTVTVQTLVDQSTTKVGVQDGFDKASAVETVTLFAAGNVSAVTTINSVVPATTTASIEVVYGNGVNPFFVAAATRVALKVNGSAVGFAASATWSGVSISASSNTAGIGYTKNTLIAGTNAAGVASLALASAATAGLYSAQAYYNGVTIGAASAVWNASAGANPSVSNISPSFVDTLDALYLANTASSLSELRVRTGTKTLTITGQLMSSSTVAIAASNIEVKAVVSEALKAGSTVAVTGAAGTLVKGGSDLIAYARTDAAGKAKGDAVSVILYAKKSNGTWGEMVQSAPNNVDIDVVWEDATATPTLTVKPASYVSGANPTVTIKAADQFGKGISTVGGKTMTAYAVASFGGVTAPKSYSANAVMTDGAATFTFANFAPAGGLAQLNVEVFTGGFADSAQVGTTQTVNVYNTAATSTISVAASFAVDVSYVDYVTGDTTTNAVATAVAAAGQTTSQGVAVTGNITNTSGVGQPGVALTATADGVLFYADGVYSLGSASTYANEYGAFSVVAIAHTANAKGATVSITSDGQTATTLLVTSLANAIADENLSFSWTQPANVVKNTTYAVTATLTDKWGNPIPTNNPSTNAVSFQGVGSVEINSVATPVTRNFDKNGQATVFLRSVKDISGPGSVTATLGATFNYALALAAPGTSSTIASFNATNAKATAWDESAWSNALTSEVEVLDVAPVVASDTKVNVGSFKGYVALYAKGHKGSKMSAIVAGKWIVVASLASDFERVVRFTGAGYDIVTTIYIDGVMIETFNTTTK
jgi:hypothetical protein